MAVGRSICPPEHVVPVGHDEPLLGRYDAARPAEKAAADGGGGNASFVQTCLNGLNALSGTVRLFSPGSRFVQCL
jgi:solute carrier family 32 (vesicular inhibitory amino acid transporter)